jgi:hypothetical protein
MSPTLTMKVPGIGGASTHSSAAFITCSPGACWFRMVKHSKSEWAPMPRLVLFIGRSFGG